MEKKKDKRYLVFGSKLYYPLGGLGDLKESFDTIDQAKDHVKKLHQGSCDSCEIYDRIEGVEIKIE